MTEDELAEAVAALRRFGTDTKGIEAKRASGTDLPKSLRNSSPPGCFGASGLRPDKPIRTSAASTGGVRGGSNTAEARQPDLGETQVAPTSGYAN